jgi:hypothetical protein
VVAMGDNRGFFDDLPQDMQKVILDFINNNKEMAAAASVSKKWNAFFGPKLKDQYLLYFLSNDNDACKKINVAQLTTAVNIYLSHLKGDDDIIELFVALKKLEKQIIAIETNPDRLAEKKELTMRSKEMQPLLKQHFGLAGLVHSLTLLHITDSQNPNIDSMIPLFALQKLMGHDDKQFRRSLDLINIFAERVGYSIPAGAMGEGLESTKFDFSNNRLHINFGGNLMPLTDMIRFMLNINDLQLQKKITDLLEELKSLSEAKPSKKL